jgi:hypothetical protein
MEWRSSRRWGGQPTFREEKSIQGEKYINESNQYLENKSNQQEAQKLNKLQLHDAF